MNQHNFILDTLQETNISPQKWHFEDDFPFPKVGYVNFLEGNLQVEAPKSQKRARYGVIPPRHR